MFSHRLTVSLAAALLLVSAAATAAPTGNWFDLEKCSMCLPMSSEEGLMEAMQWENHKISNGTVMVAIIDPAYQEAFARSAEGMKAVEAKLMAGEDLPLCGFCTSFGELMHAGAEVQEIDGKIAKLTLLTSGDEAVVEKIHAHTDRTVEEYAKMVAAKGGHEGHDHAKHAVDAAADAVEEAADAVAGGDQ